MKNLILLVITVVLLANPSAFAGGKKICEKMSGKEDAEQVNAAAEVEVDTAHDTPENDPTKDSNLTLNKEISQLKVFIAGVNPRINKNIKSSFKATLSKFDNDESQAILSDPKNYDVLKVHQYRYLPQKEYGPATVNSDWEYKGISNREFGYCWGYATMVEYFSVLAFFDSKLPRKEGLEFYRRKIDQVLAGKATVIPGFANFRELSMVPELELYLKLNAMELWKTRAARLSSIPLFKDASKTMSPTKIEDLLTDLESRLARGQLPKIVFSAKIASNTHFGFNGDIHVVLVYGVERLPNGGAKILLWDINFYTETLAREPKFLEVKSNYDIEYAPWYEPDKSYAADSKLVANVTVTPEYDAEVVQMIHSLSSFKEKAKNAKYFRAGRKD